MKTKEEEDITNSENSDLNENFEASSSEKVEASEEISTEDQLKLDLAKVNDTYLRLYSEFDNYKKRAARDRIEFTKSVGSELILSMLNVLDDFERANQSLSESADSSSAIEGINLIYNKFKNILTQKGLTEMKSNGEVFDTDLHDAVASAPSKSEKEKGRIVQELEKGYFLNGKVLRHAKVIVGS